MEMYILDYNAFKSKSSEQRLILFTADIAEYSDLHSFGLESAYEKYKHDKPYIADTYTWTKRKLIYEMFYSKDLILFNKVFNTIVEGLLPEHKFSLPSNLDEVIIYTKEWNEVVAVAKNPNTFFGISWETTS